MSDRMVTLTDNLSNAVRDTPLARYLASCAPYIVHASGIFAAPARAAYEAAKATDAKVQALRGGRAVDQKGISVAPPQSSASAIGRVPTRHPWQDRLEKAVRAGAIPSDVGSSLLRMVDTNVNRAQQSEGAVRAAMALSAVEDRAFPATAYLAQLGAMQTQVQKSAGMHQQQQALVRDTLPKVYKSPSQAAAFLRRLVENRHGPGHIAREVEQVPAILGPVRGENMFLFMGVGRKEHDAAMRAVPVLSSAIEDRGRAKERLDKDRIGLKDLESRPAREPELAMALRAQQVLDNIHAATPGPDPLSSSILASIAHMAALEASVEDIQNSVDINAPYRERLLEQAQRRDSIANLQNDKDPRNAVNHYLGASHMVTQNDAAAKKLDASGYWLEAQEAEKWRDAARVEMVSAARHILATFDLREDAASRNILAHVIETDKEAKGMVDDQAARAISLPEYEYGADD